MTLKIDWSLLAACWENFNFRDSSRPLPPVACLKSFKSLQLIRNLNSSVGPFVSPHFLSEEATLLFLLSKIKTAKNWFQSLFGTLKSQQWSVYCEFFSSVTFGTVMEIFEECLSFFSWSQLMEVIAKGSELCNEKNWETVQILIRIFGSKYNKLFFQDFCKNCLINSTGAMKKWNSSPPIWANSEHFTKFHANLHIKGKWLGNCNRCGTHRKKSRNLATKKSFIFHTFYI